jgi:hypothetical protein
MSKPRILFPQPPKPILTVFDNKHPSYPALRGWVWGFPNEAMLPKWCHERLVEMRVMLGWQLTWMQEHLIYERKHDFPSNGVEWITQSLGKLGVEMGDRLIPAGNTMLCERLQQIFQEVPNRSTSEYNRRALPIILAIDYLRLRQ